ncbi:uncharacterized protein CDAR_547541 [Caerostris darwini]|uniref:Gustatory receptor n=1 Tax=Caerostris darwini TaxID=1538125 RepID=A0AAV4WZK9_9ARAC|nr:uncharacterized protein CDAR_547541 [Caerostris darwini]
MAAETLPKLLSRSLYLFGVYVEDNDTVVSIETIKAKNLSKRSQPFWISIEMVFSHLFFVFASVYGGLGNESWPFLISGTLDLFGFVLAKDSFYVRIIRIKEAIRSLNLFPVHVHNATKRRNALLINTMIMIAFFFAVVYITYVFVVFKPENIIWEQTTNYILIRLSTAFKIVFWLFYVWYVYVGIPIFICLFVFMCLHINAKLQAIHQKLEFMLKHKTCHISRIHKQRKKFCYLQKLSSEINTIFTEIIFFWLLKIVFRCCTSMFDLVRNSWTGDDLSFQGIILLDVIFDITHLLIMCIFAAKIVESKFHSLETLTSLMLFDQPCNENHLQELNLFLSILGHSNIGMTAFDFILLNKNLALSVSGIIGSYSIIIYQISN